MSIKHPVISVTGSSGAGTSTAKVALEHMYDLVTPGGLIVLDEYGKRGWGESDAVDEFFSGKGVEIKAVHGSFQPTAYIRKPL